MGSEMCIRDSDWHPLTVWPPVATAVLCIVLFFFADPILGLAQAMVAG